MMYKENITVTQMKGTEDHRSAGQERVRLLSGNQLIPYDFLHRRKQEVTKIARGKN